MTREMALKIIEDEKRIVYATSERGGMVTNSDFVYDKEEEALEDFVFRLRAMNASVRRRISEYYASGVSEVSVADREKIKQQRIAKSYGKAVE